jgi:choline kinase
LIEVGGRSLLVRYFDALAGVGIRQAVIVVGYKQEMIRAAAGTSLSGVDVRYRVSDQYQRGSITSLWRAREELHGDVLIMDADVLFHRHILKRLIASASPTALLLDETVTQQTEECMAIVRGGRVVALSKRMPDRYDLAGEGVGFLKVQGADCPMLLESLRPHIERGELDMEYEDALRDFFERARVGYEPIGGLPWTEIDFQEDIVRAERDIVPKLD